MPQPLIWKKNSDQIETRLLNFKNPEEQLALWLEKLQAYDFDLRHRKGRSHMPMLIDHVAKNIASFVNDKRPRIRLGVLIKSDTTEMENSVSRELIMEAQRLDPDIRIIREWLEKDLKPE